MSPCPRVLDEYGCVVDELNNGMQFPGNLRIRLDYQDLRVIEHASIPG
jgi:hypothetical protein